MKKRTLVLCVLCAAVAVLCLAGCQSQKKENSDIVFDMDKDTVTVTLEENASTGHTWAYSLEPQDVLKFESDDFISANTDDKTVGVGGLHTFVFKAQKPGEVTMTLKYARAWEDTEADKTLTYQLKIDDQLNVTMK